MILGKFAEKTATTVKQSMLELSKEIDRFRATDMVMGRQESPPREFVIFKVKGAAYRVDVPTPRREDFRYTPSRRLPRSAKEQEQAWKKERRRRWRAAVHIVKAHLVEADEGWASFEDAMAQYRLLPDNRTVKEAVADQFESLARYGEFPLMLPSPE
jgi:hypothetical protein